MSSGKNRLLAFFLNSTPRAQQRKLSYVLTLPQSRRYFPSPIPTDHQYCMYFLNNLEVIGPSPAFLAAKPLPPSDYVFKLLSSFPRHVRPHFQRYQRSPSEEQQFAQNLQTCTKPAFPGSHLYNELETRLHLISEPMICKYSKKLRYLLKILINKRDKLKDDVVELESNTQLAEAVSAALSRVGRDIRSWPVRSVDPETVTQDKTRQIVPLELDHDIRLQLGHGHLRQGLKDDAICYFSSIYRDNEAPLPTRMQALKEVCQIHEAKGVIASLQTIQEELKEIDAPQLEEQVKLTLQRMERATVKP